MRGGHTGLIFARKSLTRLEFMPEALLKTAPYRDIINGEGTAIFMKAIYALITALMMTASGYSEQLAQQPSEENYDRITIDGTEYSITFDDEFDGNTLDTSKWELCPEWKRQDYNAYWDDGMTSLDGKGNLVLTMDKKGDTFYSGGIRSKGLFEQKYGYFEVRCTLNSIPGYWSAFWLMGETVSNVDDSGRDGTEIDIFESAYYEKNAVNHGLNWDGYGSDHKGSGHRYSAAGLYEGYHTFALKWTPNEYVFYVDGEESWRTSDGGVCQEPLYLKMTTETGSFAGRAPEGTSLPDSVYIDYIRVYQAEEQVKKYL